ncbi:hypothetical protein CDEF62S_01047 [Castellaniella defragrans]
MAETATATVTVNPVNDAPQGMDAHSTDPDAGQSSFQIPASLNGIYGTFTFNEATGGWSYQLDNSRAATQLLAQGEKATDTLTVASADGTVTQDIVVTITGSNDTPVVTNGAGAVTEDIDVAAGMLVVQGTVANHQALTIVDADHDQSTFNTSTVAFASNSLGASSALGTLTVNTDGTWEYQVDNSLSQVQSLAAGQTITETFTVKSADGTAASTVTVTINGANDAPVNTVPDTSTTPFTTAEDTPLAVHGVSVADVDGDLLTTTLTVTGGTVSVATGTGATVNDDGTGTVTITGSAAQVNAALAGLTFTNAPDYHGNAQITVSTGDGSLTDTDTIAITVTPVQDVADDTFTTNEDTSMVLDVLANDSFEGAHKTVTAINGTAIAVHGTVAVDHGTVTLGADGKLTFTPEADYHGAASFQYTANTDTGVAETATATVTVNPVNDAPQGTDNSFTIDEDTSHTFTTADFGFSDPADGDAFKAVAITTLPTAGALTLNGVAVTAGQSVSVADLDAGKLVFTPAPDANGNAYANFTFQVQDDGGTAFGGHDTDPTPNTITFNVTAVNDAPVPVADVAAVKESGVADGGNSPVAGTPIATGNVLTNDTDVDGDTLQVSAVSFGGTAGTVDGVTALQGVYGSLVIAADGSYTYTLDNSLAATQGLASGQKVTEAFTYTAFDGTIGVDQTLTVTVTGTNDAPVIDGAHSTVSGGVTEAGVDGAGDPVGLATVSGVVNATDVDAGDTQHWSVSTGGQSAAGAYGSLTIDAATGEWVYALDDTKPATQALKAGDTPTETFTAVVTDSHGATATQVITVTVNGSNDAASISGTATGATTEDGGILNAAKGQATAGGQLQVADVDAGENHFQTPASLAGAYGSFTFDPLTGVWSYQLDNSSAATQALAQGEKATDTLTVTSADGTAHQDIVVTITGSNDVPVVTNGTGAVTEDVDVGAEAAGMLTAHGTTANGRALTITDADHDQSTFDTGTVAFASNSLGSGSALGTLTVNADGTWEYQVDNSLSQVQSLAAGQTITETFTVKSADGTAASTVTVTITGANDAPYITSTAAAAAGSVVEAGVDGTGHAIGMATATGILTGDDVDSDDDPASLRWSLQSGGQSATGAYGSLTLDAATGKWTYTLDDTKPATQTLRAGDTPTETFTAVVTDSHGATTTQVITVMVNGSNDAPENVGAITDQASVDAATGVNLDVSGNFKDVDGDTLTYAVTGLPAGLSINAATGVITGTVDHSASQGAPDGKYAVTVTATDPSGATSTQHFTWTVTNPAPVAHDDTVTVDEDATVAGNVIAGSIVGGGTSGTPDSDPDGDALSVLRYTVEGHTYTAGSSAAVTGGLLTINADGSYTFTPEADWNGTVPSVTYTLTDGQGGLATAQLNITVNPVNDPATITGASAGAVTEDGGILNAAKGQATAGGQLHVADVDTGENHFQTPASLAGTYGSFAFDPLTGVWSYRLDNSSVATQALNQGETRTDTLTVQSADGTATQTITVTVAGTNDAPYVTSTAMAAQGSVTEAGGVNNGTAGTSTVTGTLTADDVDADNDPSNLVWSLSGGGSNATGTYGALTLDTHGNWTYTLADASAATQGLKAGETRTETFNATVTDAHGATAVQVITVTVTGSNDAPTVSGAATGNVAEDGVQTATGQLQQADVDVGDTHTWSIQGAQGAYGTLTVDQTGKWVYVLDNAKAQVLADGQTVQDQVTVRVADAAGAYADQVVTVTITGQNDAPVIQGSSTLTGAVTESAGTSGSGANHTATGHIDFTDVDVTPTADTHTVQSITPLGAGYLGSLSTGTVNDATHQVGWTFTVADGALDHLSAGQVVTQSYQVAISDGHGGTAVTTVVVTITGTNDAPVINTATSDLATTVTEIADGAAGENTFVHGERSPARGSPGPPSR